MGFFLVGFLWPTLGPGPLPLHRAGPQADLPHRLLGNTQVGAHEGRAGLSVNQIWETFKLHPVNPDPTDPHVFGPPGSGSTSQRYGSGSFYHQAKIVRKPLIPTVL